MLYGANRLGAGATFGVVRGSIYCSIAATLGVAIYATRIGARALNQKT
ncbi:MAG: hypothetical protein Q7S58_04795 [Candidatus Binatus sp.]|nr:hypothetical protein [Candidatus Binatus sp.]MDO8431712.1 hypothetical protein [Candidatus Binatus sp.]